MARRAIVPARDLDDGILERELRGTWLDRSKAVFERDREALDVLRARMLELEGEYATRHVEEMAPDPWRTRAGARTRAGQKVDGGSAPREAVTRLRAKRAHKDGDLRPGAGEGFERRQGRRRRETYERMSEGPAFDEHTIGTTGEKPPKKRPDRRVTKGKEPVENPDLVRRTGKGGRGRPGQPVAQEMGAANRKGGARRGPKSGTQG